MNIDRMALADLGNPVAIASAVLGQLPAPTVPTPVEEIAAAVGITEIAELNSAGFEGALLTDSDKMSGAILCKRGTTEQRRRFTISHELGHFLNPWHVPTGVGFECTSAQMLAAGGTNLSGRQKWEVEANNFAAEILMPSAQFNSDVRKIKSLEIAAICKLAEKYDVSKLASARRIVGIGQEDCAVLLSRSGIIEQIYRSKEFPYIPLKIGMELPVGSLSRTFVGVAGGSSELDISEPSYWSSRAIRGSNYFEQVLLQARDWRLTLLIHEHEEESSDEDESEYRNSRW